MKKLIATAILALAVPGIASAAMSKKCEEYYSAVDAMIEQAAKNESVKAQLDAMKTQMDASKQQMSAQPEASQNMVCEQGMKSLDQTKAAMGVK